MKSMFPESQLAHKWLDDLSGLEIGPSSHNPFGLNVKNVGLIDHVYQDEQQALVGEATKLDIVADAQAIPVPSESEEFVLSSHVIEHCPNMIQALLEWYRILKPGGILYLVVPHRDAAPSDRGKPLTTWNHLFSDYLINMTSEAEAEAGTFLHCHYHVFDLTSMKEHFQHIFGFRMKLLDQRPVDDKIGNGFVLVYKKEVPLLRAFPWVIEGQQHKAHVSRPADFFTLSEVNSVKLLQRSIGVCPDVVDQENLAKTSSPQATNWHSRPLVSAIMTVYEAERFMKGALDDLLEQTIMGQIEIIIVDTGSPQREQDIVREYQENHPNIVYIRTAFRESPPQAFNYGLRFAQGKYVTFANSDDRHRSDAFEVMVRELEMNPEVALVYGDVWVTRFENQLFGDYIRTGYHIRPEFSKEIMLSGCHMGPQPMWRKEIHQELGEFDGDLDSAADYEFWCRIAAKHVMRHIPQFLGLYYDNPHGMVNSNPQKSLEQTRAIQKKYSGKFPPPPQSFIENYQYSGAVQEGKFVNIGMVTYNRLDFTKKAIASLLKYTCYPHKLTIVDNGSSDGTQEYLQALQKEGIITHLILLENNMGIAKASNLAWSQEPEAEYYLKLDNDIVIQKPNWLSCMVEVVDRIPELGAVAYNFEPLSYPIKEIRGMPVRPKKGTLGGACILIPKRTHQALGFWCEDYGFYGEEDADYALRIIVQGLQNAYMEDEEIGFHLPAGRAAHIDGQTLQATDGIEEKSHAEYRAFKDECRRKNVREVVQKNWNDYQKGLKPLYCSSSFVQEFQESLNASCRSDGPFAPKNRIVEQRELVSGSNHDENSQEVVEQVSVILTDPICGPIRLLQPLMAGIGRWTQGSIATDGQVFSDDSILPVGVGRTWVFQRTCMLEESYLTQAQTQGTRLVYDCDDLLWKIPADNPNQRFLSPQLIAKMFRLMDLADCVTVSTEPIHIDLQKKGISSQVIPNSLLRQEWESLIPQRRAGSRPRVGWVGQARVHLEDTGILDTIIEALKEEVEWVFLGDAPRTARSPGVISETFSMVDLSAFPKKLASLNLDLALAPLVPNHFNEAKSDIRILQYGILGYPVIGTDIVPHQHAPILRLPHEPQAWIKAIRERIHDLDALEQEGEKVRQWVLGTRLMEHALTKYERAWLGREGGRQADASIARRPSTSVPTYTPQLTSHFDCSIIIPVFNKMELTRQCLTHLAEVTDGCSYEVIVVDNASTDGTKAFLSTLKGDIQVVSNSHNYGFAKACNQGAAAAKGRFLVFLNNDTIPKAGWLRALVDEVLKHSNVAIVGSKLLYPDDTIQHAGVVFSKKCLTPYHLFRGAPGDLKAANTRREFQVVTAACMLIRREEFDAVGGFDEIYQNGFEDVDLCLKVGKRGKQIIYQPRSVLYHLEHQTPGRKDPEAERHNGKVLMERWASSIVIDEDLYTVPEGYANHYYFRDGWLRQLLEPFRDEAERLQWERVRSVQEILRCKQKQSRQLTQDEESRLESLLAEVMEWPQDVEVLRWGAVVCRSLNYPGWESKFWERVLALGENFEAREGLVKSLLAQGSLDDASWHIQTILSKDNDHPAGNFLSGILQMQRLEYSEAVSCFQKAISGGADPAKARRGLGMAYLASGNLTLGWETFTQILQESPDDSVVLQCLLQIGTALGYWAELCGILANYLERNPADCDMRYALAGVYYRAGVLPAAQEHCEILGTLVPDFEGLQDLQTQIAQALPPIYAIAK